MFVVWLCHYPTMHYFLLQPMDFQRRHSFPLIAYSMRPRAPDWNLPPFSFGTLHTYINKTFITIILYSYFINWDAKFLIGIYCLFLLKPMHSTPRFAPKIQILHFLHSFQLNGSSMRWLLVGICHHFADFSPRFFITLRTNQKFAFFTKLLIDCMSQLLIGIWQQQHTFVPIFCADTRVWICELETAIS